MFEFAEADYKWCTYCGGNIRKAAHWCRLCRKATGSRFFKVYAGAASTAISDAAGWLPKYNSLVKKCSTELQRRFRQADEAISPPAIGIADGVDPEQARYESRDEEITLHSPPEVTPLGLVWDILLSIYGQGEPLQEICSSPRLQLLEITPQEIVAEAEMRKTETERGTQCKYCAEYILSADEEPCRFCEGFGDAVPQGVDHIFRPLDETLLRDIILFEAAMRTIDGGEPISDEILKTNSIDTSHVDREVLRQRSSSAALPCSRWVRRMQELGLKSYFGFDQMAVSEAVNVGTILRKRDDEAIIVLNHAVKRGQDDPECKYEAGRALEWLGLIYRGRNEFEKARECKEQAQELQTFGMDDEMKRLMIETSNEKMNMLGRLDFDDDPEARLLSLDESMNNFQMNSEEMSSVLDSLVPGLGSALEQAVGAFAYDSTNLARMRLTADVARKNGNIDEAYKIYSELVERAEEDWSGAMTKTSILCILAEIDLERNDPESAQTKLQESIMLAEELREAVPDVGSVALAHSRFKHANFLRDVKRFDDSYREYNEALQMQDDLVARSLTKYGGKEGAYLSEKLELLEEFAKLLRITSKDIEAAEVDVQVVRVRKMVDEANAERRERQRLYRDDSQ